MVVRWFLKGFMNLYCHIVYRIKVEGLENIPKEGPALICPNHVHALDSISFVPRIHRRVYIMAKEELFKGWFKNYIFREVDCFPVKRGKGDVGAMSTAEEYLKEGKLLLIFPEGTRNLLERGGNIKKGASLLALHENVPIIPVGFHGNYHLFSKVTIRIGKPISMEEYHQGEEITHDEVRNLTERLQEEILSLKA